MRKAGVTLMEFLVALTIMGILLSISANLFITINRTSTFNNSMPTVQQDAVEVVRIMAENLRGATVCGTGDSSCTTDAVLESPTSSSVVVYRRVSGTLTKTTLGTSGTSFQRTVSGSTTTLITDVTLSLVYYKSATYNNSTITVSSNPSGETTVLCAVGVTATVTRNGLTGTYNSIIRLRNSPKRVFSG